MKKIKFTTDENQKRNICDLVVAIFTLLLVIGSYMAIPYTNNARIIEVLGIDNEEN